MADAPIKTQGINLINTRIAEASLINTVKHEQAMPYIRETSELPVCFVFDDNETVLQQRNRIRVAEFDLITVTWLYNESGRKNISDQCDLIQADFYNLLVASLPASLISLGFEIREADDTANKFFSDENLGGIELNYRVKYKTNTNSLYTVEYDVNSNLNP